MKRLLLLLDVAEWVWEKNQEKLSTSKLFFPNPQL